MNKVYGIVTDNILALLDRGVVPWHQPWAARGASLPRNAWGRKYRGLNVFILATTAMMKGYKSSYWLTFRQVTERGGTVRKGEKSTLVIFWSLVDVKDDTAKSGTKRVPILRYYNVFSLDQTDGVTLTKGMKGEAATPDLPDTFTVDDDAEAILSSYLVRDDAPRFREAGDRAFYRGTEDTITIPERKAFESTATYYATAFHECGHSTGHKSRLDRDGIVNFDHFGSERYADEELVAEMTSAFLCAEAGIDNTLESTAAYIASWRKRLTDDPALIVKAAGRAQKAADFITGTTFDKADEEE